MATARSARFSHPDVGGLVLRRTGQEDEWQNVSINEWLEVSQESTKLDQLEESHSLQEPGLATSLYSLCSQQLARLAAVWPSSRRSASDRRRRARLADICSRLAVFGDSFEQDIVASLVDGDQSAGSSNAVNNIGGDLRADERYLRSSLEPSSTSLRPEDAVNRPGRANHADDATVTASLRQVVSQAKNVLDESDTDGGTSSATESDDASDTARPEHAMEAHCLRPLSTYIDLLMDLCPTLEQAYNDMYKSSSRSLSRSLQRDIFVTPAALPYVTNVKDKFPRANQELVKRLGEANWQRHERLRTIQTNGPSSEPQTVQDSKSLFQPVSIFQDSALGSSLRSQSQRAMSNASHSSFISSNADQETRRFKVPGFPSGALYGWPFACPYCTHTVFNIKNRIDWKMHVLADLNAYICTFSGCSLKTFSSRKLWFEHETTYHLTSRSLQCQLCVETFEDPEQFLRHAQNNHEMTLDTGNLKLAALNVATVSQLKPADSITCPLCFQTGWSRHREYSTHLGRHLEEIALCALPPGGEDDDDDDDSDEVESDHVVRKLRSEAIVQCGMDEQTAENAFTQSKTEIQHKERNPEHLGPPSVFTPVHEFNDASNNSNIKTPHDSDPSYFKPTSAAEASASKAPSNQKHKCPYCATEFNLAQNLKTHLLTHSQEKPYVCSTCSERFRRLDDLKRHSKLHDFERLFMCHICERKFARGDDLARHKNVPGGCSGRRAGMGSFGDDDEPEGVRPGAARQEHSEEVQERPGPPSHVPTDLRQNKKEEEDYYTIRCICAYPDDDGNTVYCMRCDTWQHIDCYYNGMPVPDEHLCVHCVPRDLDAGAAAFRLRQKLLAVNNVKETSKRKPKPRRKLINSETRKEQQKVSADSGYISEPSHDAVPERPSTNHLGLPSPPATSHWSVAEQQRFRELLDQFGLDFGAIAGSLKIKTSTMVQEYYHRCIEKGDEKLKKLAEEAEQKRLAGKGVDLPRYLTKEDGDRYYPMQQAQTQAEAQTLGMNDQRLPSPTIYPQMQQNMQTFTVNPQELYGTAGRPQGPLLDYLRSDSPTSEFREESPFRPSSPYYRPVRKH